MENCRHENKYLMGTADGIVCRACGKLFTSFADIHGDEIPPAEEKPTEAKKTAKNSRKKKGEA
jgi:hypothetical protein